MRCKLCGSRAQKNFNGELAIHFPGYEGLTKPVVLLFPTLNICLECGLVEFVLADAERERLIEGVTPIQTVGATA